MNPNNNLFAFLTAVAKKSVETPQYFSASPGNRQPERPRLRQFHPHAQFTTLSMREEWLETLAGGDAQEKRTPSLG